MLGVTALQYCNSMLQTWFIVCQNFIRSSVTCSQKFEKEKNCFDITLFGFFPVTIDNLKSN